MVLRTWKSKETGLCVSEDGSRVSLANQRLTSLPDWLGNLTALTELDLSGTRLTSLPESVGNLTALTSLNLSGTRLTSLPESVGNLTALTSLNLSYTQLTSLPDWLGNLTALTSLNLSYTRLTSLPDWLGNLTALTSLNLSYTRLTSLPDWLGNLTALTELDLSGTRLTSLPDWLGNLTALTELDLSGTRLTSLPDWLGNLTALTSLNLSGTEPASLPDWLGNLTALTSLNLSGTRLTSWPDWLGNLTALTELDLSDTQLTSLPDWLGNLTALTSLNLSRTRLTSWVESVGNLTALTELDLSRTQLTSLPDWLGNLTALTSLNLNGTRLTSLPESVGNLTALTELDLSRTQLTSLPDWLGNLTALTSLNLNGTQLTSLPESVGNLAALTSLLLGGTQLTSLPESVGNLTALTSLNLSRTQLTSLPDWLGNLTALTSLNLNGTQLTSLPESVGNLAALTSLLLGGTQLTSLPESVGNLTALAELDLSRTQLTSLPESVGNLAALTSLLLGGTQLTSLPESVGNLTALAELDLSGTQLTSWPESLGNLTTLTSLNLGNYHVPGLPDLMAAGVSMRTRKLFSSSTLPDSSIRADSTDNCLTSLPDWIGNLTALTSLDLSGTRLTSLPESVGNLTALTELDLSGTRLTSLPESVGNLTALTELDLSGTRLTSLPESVGNLTALTELDLSRTQLTSLPESVGNLTALRSLLIAGNPLRSPLLEIAEDGTPAVKAYLSLLMDQAAELWVSKLLVVGEGAVGKTSLVKSLVGDEYDKDEPTTHGIRISDVELDNPVRSDVRMHLSSWDFGGQDIYHATHQFFLSDRSLFVLLWNARQGWEQAKLPYWLDIIQARAPHARVILVATHAEGRPIDLPLTDLRETYPQIVGSASVDNRNREGIDELRRMMAEEAAKLPLMGSRWPATWVSGVETIRTCDMQYATPEELYHRLAAVGVVDRAHQTYLLRALHVLGDILYFDEDEDLRDTIILRPQWVNGYIAKVLDSPEVAAQHGLLTRSHERDLWSDLNPGLRDRFLQMMEKFDLSYRTADHRTAASLVVERLPWDSPPYQERWNAALEGPGAREIRLRYQLNTLPPGVPTWFIAREHRFTTGTQWRSGAFLRYTGDHRIYGLIRAERKDSTVELAVRGPVPQLFFSVLQDGFESTLNRYQGLEVTRLVPCTCECGDGTQAGKPCMHLYQYGPLLRRLERGVGEVECELSFSKINVAELLFGIAPATTDQLMAWMDKIDHRLSDFQAEAAWAQREFLKALRSGQIRSEALCPSVFTLTPAASRGHPGFHRLELRLYCEQPGSFHALTEAPYIINQPTRWLKTISPYLVTLVTILKHTAPLVGPVLGLTADHLAKQLGNEIKLMTELISQLPNEFATDEIPDVRQTNDLQHRVKLDADYRAIYAVLHQLDPSDHWAGLNRILSPEDQILWLCSDHAQQYAT